MNQEQLDSFLQQHTKGTLSVSELLAKFLEQPANASQESSILSRIRRASFPTEATLESYDWTRNPNTIRREPFYELSTGEFIRRKENLAFVGLSGLGKTHLMQGVARKCCALGYRVKYETSASLIETLNQARAVKRLTPKVRQYCSYELLIIDEELRSMISRRVHSAQIRDYAVEKGMDLLETCGKRKVASGETTVVEVQRVTSRLNL